MKKYLLIAIIISSCCSGQVKDKATIDNNNKAIGKTEKASEIINKPELTKQDREYIKDTLSECKLSLQQSNESIKNCNVRESKLKDQVNLLLPFKVKYRKLILSVIIEHLIILLIFYLVNRIRINTAISKILKK